MKLSEGRLSFLAHRILDALRREKLVEVENERLALAEVKRALGESSERDARIDAAVRQRITSLSRRVPPGSREWEVLYQKYLEEEMRKQKS
jgi:hypothetical protein